MAIRFLAQRVISGLIRDKRPHEPFTWGWLNRYIYDLFWRHPGASIRPAYAWGTTFAGALGRALGLPAVALMEFGVAGGKGLVAMQQIAAKVSADFGIALEVYGFDTGAGLPEITDLRDMPQLWQGGDFKMNFAPLQAKLGPSTKLILGDVRHTLPEFLESQHAPVGFVSLDVDLYSASHNVLSLFRDENPIRHCLPRVVLYADDIMGTTMSPITGERLAIREYNDRYYPTRCISPVYGLRYDLDWPHSQARWPDMLFWSHVLDHPRYREHDRLRPRQQHLPI